MSNQKKLFGTDGIRGVANQPPLTVDMISRIARAATYALKAGKVVIGKDTRLSGYLVESALTAGFCSMGADVHLVGPMPTPGIAFLTSNMRADLGVVISASHNPYQDNGIKFFGPDGFKLSDALENKITELTYNNHLDEHLPTAAEIGKVLRVKESKGRYLVFAKNSFPSDLTLDGVKIVVDCAHGATYRVAPEVFSELGAEVITIGDKPDGKNINADCGAVHPEPLCRRVIEAGADLGVALDGDGDRAIFCDETGKPVHGDSMIALLATYLKKAGRLKKNGVVATVMSNFGLQAYLEREGIALVQTDVGDRYVVEAMRREGYSLGGEQSGHIVLLDHTTTGDGIITALQVLAIIVKEKKKLSQLTQLITLYPQTLLSIEVREKRNLQEISSVQKAIREVESSLGAKGRIHVRYSGTENVARVMVEGEKADLIRKYAESVASSIREAVGAEV